MNALFTDRIAAGQALVRPLLKYRKHADVIVLALPRGGVPVGAEIAHALHAPFDVVVVRKLGAPSREDLAMGAIADGGICVLDEDVVGSLGIGGEAIATAAARERAELERRMSVYRGGRPWPAIEGKRVIVVDDGVATGLTMRAAIAAVRAQQPAKIVLAVPVAAFHAVTRLRREAEEVVCLATPEPFNAIAGWYSSFPQVSDVQVRLALAERWAHEDQDNRVAG
jgi:putative phosphoribosyl transferase